MAYSVPLSSLMAHTWGLSGARPDGFLQLLPPMISAAASLTRAGSGGGDAVESVFTTIAAWLDYQICDGNGLTPDGRDFICERPGIVRAAIADIPPYHPEFGPDHVATALHHIVEDPTTAYWHTSTGVGSAGRSDHRPRITGSPGRHGIDVGQTQWPPGNVGAQHCGEVKPGPSSFGQDGARSIGHPDARLILAEITVRQDVSRAVGHRDGRHVDALEKGCRGVVWLPGVDVAGRVGDAMISAGYR